MNIEVGQAIAINIGITVRYGVVMDVKDGIDYYEVDKLFPDGVGLVDRVRCYDDFDAVKERDEHNVRMVGCPPPMSVFGKRVFPSGLTTEDIYVDANPDHMRHLSGDDLQYVSVMDDGIKFSDMNMNDIYNHRWASRMHREFVLSDQTERTLDETVHRKNRVLPLNGTFSDFDNNMVSDFEKQ